MPARFFAAASLLILSVLGGCGTVSGGGTAPPAAPDAVSESIDKDGRFVTLIGPKIQHGEPFMGVPGTNIAALRSAIDRRSGEVMHQLYVEDSYTGPERNWDSAQDASGKSLRFIPIGKDEIDCSPQCSYAEEFAAALPEPELRAAQNGLPVFFRAKSGAQMAIVVPAPSVAKQLAAVDTARATMPTASAAAPSAPPPSPPPRL